MEIKNELAIQKSATKSLKDRAKEVFIIKENTSQLLRYLLEILEDQEIEEILNKYFGETGEDILTISIPERDGSDLELSEDVTYTISLPYPTKNPNKSFNEDIITIIVQDADSQNYIPRTKAEALAITKYINKSKSLFSDLDENENLNFISPVIIWININSEENSLDAGKVDLIPFIPSNGEFDQEVEEEICLSLYWIEIGNEIDLTQDDIISFLFTLLVDPEVD